MIANRSSTNSRTAILTTTAAATKVIMRVRMLIKLLVQGLPWLVGARISIGGCWMMIKNIIWALNRERGPRWRWQPGARPEEKTCMQPTLVRLPFPTFHTLDLFPTSSANHFSVRQCRMLHAHEKSCSCILYSVLLLFLRTSILNALGLLD